MSALCQQAQTDRAIPAPGYPGDGTFFPDMIDQPARAFRAGDFETLSEALEYAACGSSGYSFYRGGKLDAVLSYAGLRRKARNIAAHLQGFGLRRGDRMAIIAETSTDFVSLFFASHYAGLVPVPLPVSVSIGGGENYTALLRRLLLDSGSQLAFASVGELGNLKRAAQGLELPFVGTLDQLLSRTPRSAPLHQPQADELAYVQYTSGSTRFPKGVMIPHRTVMANLAGIIGDGVKMGPDDRCASWLPFYHDMGLVGLLLAPMAAQVPVDFMDTREFAVRPRRWMELISASGATISFGPPFAYELVARRLRDSDIATYDLSGWRVAGVGAEPIRHQVLADFSERLASAGFDSKAFVPSYGMAECSLAVSFASLDEGVQLDSVDTEVLALTGYALPAVAGPDSSTCVSCGSLLPGYESEIRDAQGRVLSERRVGTLFVRGPSVMSGYLGRDAASDDSLSEDGWLNTGDLAYQVDDKLYITGRSKDLIIINGRNIWPQDMEALAERQEGVRSGDALAFSVPADNGAEQAVMVVQYTGRDEAQRLALVEKIQGAVSSELGIAVQVELVPRHTLPRTSSGKLSRSRARQNYLACRE